MSRKFAVAVTVTFASRVLFDADDPPLDGNRDR